MLTSLAAGARLEVSGRRHLLEAGMIDRGGEITRIAAAYPTEAEQVPAWEREQFLSPDQLAAWEMRFGRDLPPPADATDASL